jgi:hypothetical protein
MAARDAGTSGAVPCPGEPDTTQDRPTSLAPHDAADDEFAFACSLLLPHTGWGSTFGPDGQVTAVRLWDGDGAWAGRRLRHRPAGRTLPPVGDRVEELWAQVAGDDATPPARYRYGMTVTPDGSTVWLDDPGSTL